jgi:hypothetical protein
VDALTISNAGNVTAPTDMRAPIFYDSDNTAFFFDGAASTNINALYGNGKEIFATADSYLRINESAGFSNGIWMSNSNFGGGAGTFHLGSNGDPTTSRIRIIGGTYDGSTVITLNGVDGVGTSTASWRAPIFYDSNDTSYYVDPNSASRLRSVYVTDGTIDPSNVGAGVGLGFISEPTTGFAANGITFGSGTGQHGAIVYGSNIMYFGTETGTDNTMTAKATLNSTGTLIVNGDVRSQTFYDSNDTNRYLDPAGTSVLTTVEAYGGSGFRTFANGSASITSQIYFANAANTRAWNWQLDENNDAALWNFEGSSWNKRFTFTAGSHFTAGGIITANVDIRAPIFYDSNNTGYFLDPNTTGNALRTAGYWLADTTAWAGDINGKIQYHDNSWYFSAANRWIFRASSGAEPFTVSQAGIAIAAQDMRAPRFYDNDNTAYYFDGAGTSVTNIISSEGGIGVAGAGATNDPYGRVSVTRPGDANYSYYGLTRQGSLGMGMGIDTSNLFWVGSTNAGYNGTRSSVYFQSNTSGDVTAASSLRAPIFYDSNDTGYYWDFASGAQSNINTYINGLAYYRCSFGSGVYSGAVTSPPLQVYSQDGGTAMFSFHRSGAYAINMGLDPDNALRIGGWSASANRWVLDGSGNNTVAGSFRAPIFYDSDNTAFYVDPASGTVLGGGFTVTGSRPLVYSPGGGDLSIKGDAGGWATGLYFLGSSGTNRGGFGGTGGADALSYLWAGNAYNNAALYLYATNYAVSPGSFRAPIFYDSDNTGYYLDPASNFNFLVGGSVTYTGTTSGLYVTNAEATGATVRLGAAYSRAGVYSNTSMHVQSENTIEFWTQNGQRGYFDNSSNLFANASMRSPIFYDSDNTAYYLDAASTGTSLNVAGAIVAAGNVTAYSDIRVKANVETITSALDKLDQIRGVTYTRTDLDDKEQRYAGVIAQEIEAVLPEAVRDLGDIKAVDYNATIGLLIQAVKELTNKVKALEAKEY